MFPAVIAILIVGICVGDVGWRWWRLNDWRPRSRIPSLERWRRQTAR